MTTLSQSPNAFHATHLESVDKELQYMNANLEEIQRSLEMYLENKRRQFPRFYFISNDDLLEILGQSKNPPGVMPHMKKLFDNIKTLTLVKTTANGPMAATEMRSNEDEVVSFDGQVSFQMNLFFKLNILSRSYLMDKSKNGYVMLKIR
jgi:dynein heavy chain